MKKLSHQTWAKAIALCLAVVSGITCVLSLAGMVLIAGFGEQINNPQQYIDEGIAENYAARMLDNAFNSELKFDSLDGGNLEYTVMSQVESSKDADTEMPQQLVYSNNDGKISNENFDYVYSGAPGDDFYYNTTSMVGAVLEKASNWSENHAYIGTDLNGYAFNYETGKMYAITDEHYILVKDLMVDFPDETAQYYWDSEKNAYLNELDNMALDISQYKSWLGFYADDSYYIGPDDSGMYHVAYVQTKDLDSEKTIYEDQDYYMSNGMLYYPYEIDGKVYQTYSVYMKVKSPANAGLTFADGSKDYFYEAEQCVDLLKIFQKYGVILQIGSLAVLVINIIFLSFGAGHRKEDEEIHLRWMDKVPFIIVLGVTFVGVVLGASANIALVLNLADGFSLGTLIALELELAALWMLLLLECYLTIITRVKAHCFGRYTLLHYVIAPIRNSFRWIKKKNSNIKEEMHENISLFWKVVGILVALSFVELLVIVATGYNPGMEILLFLIYKVVEAIVVIGIVLQMNSLKEGGQRIAQGDYSKQINTNGMYWEFKKHAENINQVGNGISLAVDERMKSEHFKTELITNVSHDIKTPLTSIINYVDLIKKENISDPTLLEYVDVLDRQSARLKKLIEDLMEASKASTGNLSVNLEKCDATVMLTQVVGEFEERTAANELKLIVTHPETPVYIMADGRHLWRVFDNLLSNVCKYAQPGTRVYVNLDQINGNVNITFRNTSKYQLNITSEELMERFVRGDSSRNTEGNGLGLSIAQSLTTLQNGNLKLDVDGDLFKVTLTFAEVVEGTTN